MLETIVIEMLVDHLPTDRRQVALDLMTANAKQVVDLAPKAQLANAQKIQAAAMRQVAATAAESIAEVEKGEQLKYAANLSFVESIKKARYR